MTTVICITTPQVGPAVQVAREMRAADRAELAAMDRTLDPVVWAVGSVNLARAGAIVWLETRPVVFLSLISVTPVWWEAQMVATDAWQQVARATTRFVRRELMPAVAKAAVHRVECRVLAAREGSRRWLAKALGAREELILRGLGCGGEDFVLMAWSRS